MFRSKLISVKWGKRTFRLTFYYELQVKKSVTIFGHKKKDRMFVMKFVMKKSIKYRMFVMTCGQEFVMTFFVKKQQNFTERSEWKCAGVRNDKYMKVVIKTTGCSEWKGPDVRKHIEIYFWENVKCHTALTV